jgi:hypothetical protein
MRLDSHEFRSAVDEFITGGYREDRDDTQLCRGCDGLVYVNEDRYCAECVAVVEQAEEGEDADAEATG